MKNVLFIRKSESLNFRLTYLLSLLTLWKYIGMIIITCTLIKRIFNLYRINAILTTFMFIIYLEDIFLCKYRNENRLRLTTTNGFMFQGNDALGKVGWVIFYNIFHPHTIL